jgi:Protein of unknown function (DUF1769)
MKPSTLNSPTCPFLTTSPCVFLAYRLERPCGKLPPKWIVNGALNVVRFFAPQLQTNVTGPRPYSLTPLGSTPQSLIVHDMETDEANDSTIMKRMKCDVSMEVPQEEPRIDHSTLMGHASTASSSMQRARHRKKHFDKVYSDAHHTHTHRSNKSLNDTNGVLHTDPSKVYTFEFLQHLLSFDDFTIELGSIVGSVPLQSVLHGQPLQIMSSYQVPVPLATLLGSSKCKSGSNNTGNDETQNRLLQNRIWCFDIWHEMLYADAKAYDDSNQAHGVDVSLPLTTTVSHHESDVFCHPSP